MNGNSKLALGTAQFGLDYGINNTHGKMSHEQVAAVMQQAAVMGITLFDTAYHYGDSEEKMGAYLKQSDYVVRIVSKAPAIQTASIETVFEASLQRLKINAFYGYLIHSFDEFCKNPASWDFLQKQREQGRVQKIGFSLYFPRELEWLLDHDVDFDLVQVPFSVFDQRFKPYFKGLKEKKIEVHARSIFLQGLVFKRPDQLDTRFLEFREKLEVLDQLSTKHQVTLQHLCLNFAHAQPEIDALIVGIDHEKNLQENGMYLAHKPVSSCFLTALEGLAEPNEKLIVPLFW